MFYEHSTVKLLMMMMNNNKFLGKSFNSVVSYVYNYYFGLCLLLYIIIFNSKDE